MPVPDALKWINQKIGNFFGDFKDERELQKDPGVCRDITRFVCLLCLLGAFGYAFYWLFMDAPNVEVKRVYLHNKLTNFAIDRLYNSSASYGTDIDAADNSSGYGSASQDVLDCPCTNTTISWTSYVHFYIINYITPAPAPPALYYEHSSNDTAQDTVTISSDTSSTTLNVTAYVSRDTVDLTTEKFCKNNIKIWPERFENVERASLDCPALVSALLSSKPSNSEIPSGADAIVGSTNWNDPRASYFESPSLQSQKFLYSNTIRRLRAYQQAQFTLLNSAQGLDTDNATYRKMFLTGMTDLWLYALDRFGANSSSTDLQFFQVAADRSFQTSDELSRFWSDGGFAVVLYEGQSFLGMNINWTEYYNTCSPAFCDVTRRNSAFHRTYTTLAQVGGLWGFAVVVVTLLVWPGITFLLVRCVGCCTSKATHPDLVTAPSRILSRAPSAYKKLETSQSTDDTLEVNL